MHWPQVLHLVGMVGVGGCVYIYIYIYVCVFVCLCICMCCYNHSYIIIIITHTGISPYLSLLDGGKEGAFYNEMVNYFYYAQLRAQGENSTNPRRISGYIPVSEVVNVMRALGYYPR